IGGSPDASGNVPLSVLFSSFTGSSPTRGSFSGTLTLDHGANPSTAYVACSPRGVHVVNGRYSAVINGVLDSGLFNLDATPGSPGTASYTLQFLRSASVGPPPPQVTPV